MNILDAIKTKVGLPVHNHTLDGIVGYRVVETNGQLSNRSRTVAWFSATNYYSALVLRQSILGSARRGMVCIDTEYECGCLSVARRHGERSIWGEVG